VKERLAGGTTGLYDTLKKHQAKTFADLYKAEVATTQNVVKTIKAGRKLPRRLLSVVIAGRTVEMVNVIKYALCGYPALGANGHKFEHRKRSKPFQRLISQLTTSWVADHVKWRCCLH